MRMRGKYCKTDMSTAQVSRAAKRLGPHEGKMELPVGTLHCIPHLLVPLASTVTERLLWHWHVTSASQERGTRIATG